MRRLPPTLAVLLLAACVPQPVLWDAEVDRLPGALADSARLEFDRALVPRYGFAWAPPSWPAEASQCTATLRAAIAPNGTAYASWFTVRNDSSVVLRVARSDDRGLHWLGAVTADATDVGRAGCARNAPFVSVDSLNDYVHVVYHLVAREGAGIFFAHSMDGGALFHEPVPIVYGDRPSASSVASIGDTVIVAYEDPNSRSPRLGLAISFTQGHIFATRTDASDETGEARTPRVVVRGGRVAVAWTVTQQGGGAPRTALRLGTLQPSAVR